MKAKYVGGSQPGVEVRFPGRTVVAVNGEPFELTEAEAESLGDNFEVESKTKTKGK